MELLGLIAALIALVVIGVGVSLGLMACIAAAALAGAGVISTSVIIGFWKRRTLAGVQAFFCQCGVLLGAPAGALMTWGAWHVWPMVSGDWRVLTLGAVGGAAGALIVAWLASAAAARFTMHAWPWLRGRVTFFTR